MKFNSFNYDGSHVERGITIDNIHYIYKPTEVNENGDSVYFPITEYIASLFFKSAGLKTHDVVLTNDEDGEPLALCRDFTFNDENKTSKKLEKDDGMEIG